MKLLPSLIASLVLIANASAVEYVTLTSVTKMKSVAPTALVEIVGFSGIAESEEYKVSLTFSDGVSQEILLRGEHKRSLEKLSAVNPVKGNKFTGLTSISREKGKFTITLKITPVSELNFVASGVVTLSADVGVGCSVTLQESSDLFHWNAIAPGSFTGGTTPKFFRVLLKRTAE